MTEVEKEFKEPTKEDWNEFHRVNKLFYEKNGKYLIDFPTIVLLNKMKLNPEQYDTRLPDELINRTDGKVAIVYPYNSKPTEIIDDPDTKEESEESEEE